MKGTLDFGLRVARVRPQRQHEEESAEDVFAFGDPGDGFDVQRVQGEEGGDGGAAAGAAGHAGEGEEEQQRAEAMDQEADQVMAGGVEAEKLDVQHVGEPGERMPVALVAGRERPGDGGPGQPALNGWVFINVGLVVAIDEGSVVHWPERGEGRGSQEQANEQPTAG